MATFFDLPDEIHLLIFVRLSNRDIDVLFQIDEFKRCFHTKIVLFTDSYKTLFPHVPLKRPLKLLPRYDAASLLVAMCESENVQAMKKHDKAIYSITANRNDNFPSQALDASRCKLHPITFEFITLLGLENATIDPSKINFPKLEDLRLQNCEFAYDADLKFLISNLKSLTVGGKFDQIHRSIDYSNCSLKQLTLGRISDMDKWENVTNSSIKELKIFRSFKEIKDIAMKGATYVFIGVDRKLDNLYLPMANNLDVEAKVNPSSIDGINAPAVNRVGFLLEAVDRFWNVHIPNVQSASVMSWNGFNHIALDQVNLTCLENTKRLEISGRFLSCLKRCYATWLSLEQDEYLPAHATDFPELTDLEMDTRRGTGVPIPKVSASKLRFLHIIGNATDQINGSYFDPYPNLEYLMIRSPRKLKDWKIASLKVLEFFDEIGESEIEFTNCDLENLEYLVMHGSDGSRLVNGLSGLKAPNLIKMLGVGITIRQFSTEKYPKLMKLVLNHCCLRELKLTGCPALIHLVISDNHFRIRVESDQLNSLKILFNGNTMVIPNHPNLVGSMANDSSRISF
jgi:hypothetical protein